jgi:Dolichyl-phosphate-mannose-protein mannosyltransferase
VFAYETDTSNRDSFMAKETSAPVLDEKSMATGSTRLQAQLQESNATQTLPGDSGPALHSGSGEPSNFENALTRFAALLSRHSYAIVSAWIAVVAVAMAGFSRQKPLWADEVLFRWITTLPSTQQIWQALKLGLNTDPPVAHFLTHALTSVLGSGNLIVRLASMAGICVMLLCLFLTLKKYIGPLYALVGVLLPFCTMLVEYGYEARPYGLMYGFFGLAIFCWDKAGEDGSHRFIWNVALGLSLAAALGCHFYSVFAIPAFCLGEAVRTYRRRRLNWPTIVAILAASVSILFYLPIIIGARQYSSSYFEKPWMGSVPGMLVKSLDQLVIPLFAFLAFAALFATLGVHFTRESSSVENPRFRELAALGLGFLLVPVLAWGAGIFVLKAFTTRYVLHGLLGVFLLLPLFAGRVFRLDRALGLALVMACGLPALLFAGQGLNRLRKPTRPSPDLARLEQILPQFSGDIVVSDPHFYFELLNDSPALKAKCIYLWDRQNEVAYTAQDGFSHLAAAGTSMGFFRSEAWRDYPNRDNAFLFLTVPDAQPDGIGWLRGYLETEQRYGNVVAKAGRYVVVAAKPKQDAALLSTPPLPSALRL